jgi:hypothetical protein
MRQDFFIWPIFSPLSGTGPAQRAEKAAGSFLFIDRKARPSFLGSAKAFLPPFEGIPLIFPMKAKTAHLCMLLPEDDRYRETFYLQEGKVT